MVTPTLKTTNTCIMLYVMQPNDVLIQLNNASFRYGTEEYLFKDLKLTVKKGDRTAIVGINGSGKTTLLKLLTGELPLEEGERFINCKSYYVPQVSLAVNQENLFIYEYIQSFYEDWWEIPSEVERLFNLTINTEALANTLSGGELMKLNMAIALKHNPDVLILDEPTNHLDVKSTKALIDFIKSPENSKYTYVIVSHAIFFINSVVTKIWELDKETVTTYGGDYDFYLQQKEFQLKGLKKQYDVAKAQLERALENEQKEVERRAHKANQAKRAFIKGSMDRTEFSEGKNNSGSSLHTITTAIERLKEDAEESLDEFETEERKLAFIILKNTKENYGRTICEIKDSKLIVDDKTLIKDINLKLVYGDRIVIAGDNGTGKSSLIKAVLDKGTERNLNPNIKLEGEVYVGTNLNWVFIDQNYSLIKPELDLIQNLMQYNNSFTEDIAKEQLGKYKFRTKAELNKLGKQLSGGEMVRLVLAMITSNPVDMLILDEPTNNLDVATVEVLVKSLNQYRGTLVVISHNIDFLNKINIKGAYIIKDKKLKVLNADPSKRDEFYKALLG
jgi:ATPase subunit of ABC transporter with duplicated ATPase domains